MCGAPRRAAVAAACTSSPLTSGSACGRHWSRWLATRSASAWPAISARAASRCMRSHSVPVRSSSTAAATRPWARRSPSGPSRPAASSASRAGASSLTATPATAATTCGSAPSPRTASAAATARSRGASVASRQRMTLRAIAETGGASSPARSIASGPCVAICRPSSPSSHGLPPTARWQSRHTAAEVSGARRRMSCAAPRGVSRWGAGRSPTAPRRAGSAGPTVRAGRRRGRRRRSAAAGRRSAAPGSRAPPARSGRPTARRRSTSASGRCSASAEHSHRTPWATSIVESPLGTVPSSSSVPAGAAAPSSSCARSSSEASRSGASSSARTTPKGKWRSSGPGAARRTRQPASAAVSRGVLEQRRLAQARGRVEHDDPAVALGQAADRSAQHLDLDRALDQRRVAGAGRGLRCDDVEMGHRAATRGTDHVRCDAPEARNLPDRRAKTRRSWTIDEGRGRPSSGSAPDCEGPWARCCHRVPCTSSAPRPRAGGLHELGGARAAPPEPWATWRWRSFTGVDTSRAREGVACAAAAPTRSREDRYARRSACSAHEGACCLGPRRPRARGRDPVGGRVAGHRGAFVGHRRQRGLRRRRQLRRDVHQRLHRAAQPRHRGREPRRLVGAVPLGRRDRRLAGHAAQRLDRPGRDLPGRRGAGHRRHAAPPHPAGHRHHRDVGHVGHGRRRQRHGGADLQRLRGLPGRVGRPRRLRHGGHQRDGPRGRRVQHRLGAAQGRGRQRQQRRRLRLRRPDPGRHQRGR